MAISMAIVNGPTPPGIRAVAFSPDAETLAATSGLSFADIKIAVDNSRKAVILDGRDQPSPGEVRDMLLARNTRLS